MIFVALTLTGAARSIRQDMSLVDQTSMIQLPLQQELPGQSPVARLKATLPAQCGQLAWATQTDCDLSKELVELILAQNGGATGNDMDVAKRVANVDMLVFSPAGAILTALDADFNGNLSKPEIRPIITGDAGMGLQDASIPGFMSLFDSNHDGTLVMPEVYQFGRACLVVRQFLRDIDTIQPSLDSAELLPLLESNVLHVPDSSPENLKWHNKFVDLLANLTAECHTLTWATEEDCEQAQVLLNTLVTIPTWNTTQTLIIAQTLCQLQTFLHVPDQYAFGLLDSDGNGAFGHEEYMALSAPIVQGMGAAGNSLQETLFELLDHDGARNVTREKVYAFVRGGLVLRHFMPELDPVSPGRVKDGTPKLLDHTALNMAIHIIDPPPLAMPKMTAGPKLLSVFGIMLAAFIVQWFCCAAKPKAFQAEEEKDVK